MIHQKTKQGANRGAPQTNPLDPPPRIPTNRRIPRPTTIPVSLNKAGAEEEGEEAKQEAEATVLPQALPPTATRPPRDLQEADPEAGTGGDQGPPVDKV